MLECSIEFALALSVYYSSLNQNWSMLLMSHVLVPIKFQYGF
jgi:hypothetical protein